MRLNRRTVLMVGACLVGAGFMFFLGVMTERRWAAERLPTTDGFDLDALIEASDAAAANQTIDIRTLEYPEALRSRDSLPDDFNTR
ncbi:hypothetical protein DSCO28_39910 [Desulfosarcina ovata subsp. sediminis]|uniref:Uncharacterized protein n=1 Tax=Desulfosarcina ovata subsp. sediminis TaxID=885957 RepID=A0A5K7ZT95_9BACT|nr:hypothetical protein [Desulfosarcina ovata]BBO83425.1 hypothetical protein DSCO28_39910 [Desulfosarcina ovata subsp. sediminis]